MGCILQVSQIAVCFCNSADAWQALACNPLLRRVALGADARATNADSVEENTEVRLGCCLVANGLVLSRLV